MDRMELAMEKLGEDGCDMAVISKDENIFYLTGFKPSSRAFLILADEPILIVNSMDLAEAENRSSLEVFRFKKLEDVKEKIGSLSPREVIFEPSTPIGIFEKLKGSFNFIIKDIISDLRIIKEKVEINNIKKALKIAEKSFMEISIEGTEAKIAAELEYHMKINGSKKSAFDTIVASGPRSSNPHAEISFNKVQTPTIIDWGATCEGYSSDTTRTIITQEHEEEILDILLDAQREGVKTAKPGVKASYIDKTVRNIITEYGYGDNFIHSTGHGIGLEVHEPPSISASENIKLEKNMIITIEPGIYIKGEYGIRTENMILIRKNPKILNTLPSKI
ncbi:MAG TPA: aminopeptidase P family protein [Methanothermobacter sp.]|nr:aminopeptidase P [Methanothermobacter sp. MT-2]HHW05395.1 M24 family metallopeptidase [Methanothermobacter sp.]HOK73150.1 aminopeptidase P family protein [Methanothermobacter sp.]HOL68782.1 aminopeptidase P family protein [Methanothermobacter sp.]HPQ04675.1 aminopeptidase P family protein [Methanothermobacter sp.]